MEFADGSQLNLGDLVGPGTDGDDVITGTDQDDYINACQKAKVMPDNDLLSPTLEKFKELQLDPEKKKSS